MISSTFSIAFDFVADQGKLNIRLTADVEPHHSQLYYTVKHFRTAGQTEGSVLPDIAIKKVGGLWVHIDSGKETQLSDAVGRAIDEYER